MSFLKSMRVAIVKTANGLLPMDETTKVVDKQSNISIEEPTKTTVDKQKKPTKKEQLANSKAKAEMANSGALLSEIADSYLEKLLGFKESGRESYITMKEKNAEMTYIAIQTGSTLIEAQKELSKREYEMICKKYNVSKRTIDRLKEVASDKRVVKLTKEQLLNIKNVSQKKLVLMRNLSDADFKKVINGKDEAYSKMIAAKKDDELKELKSPYSFISDEDYQKLSSESKEFCIAYINENLELLKKKDSELRKLRKELRELKAQTPKSANNSTKSNSKNKAA